MYVIISAVRISIEELENDNLGSEFLEVLKGRLYEKPQHTFIESFTSLILLVIYIDALL